MSAPDDHPGMEIDLLKGSSRTLLSIVRLAGAGLTLARTLRVAGSGMAPTLMVWKLTSKASGNTL